MAADHWRYHVVSIAMFATSHYAVLIGVATLSYAIGRKLTATCEYHSTTERVAVCTTLGLGATSYLVLGLAVTHWLYRGVVIAALSAAALLCYPELTMLSRELTAFVRAVWKLRQFSVTGLSGLIISLPFLLLPLYPPGRLCDDTMYHLPLAQLYLQRHGFVFAPHVHLSLLPQVNEMLFTLMLALFDDVAAQSMSFLMMVVLLIAVFALGERIFTRTVAWWAVAILLGVPLVARMGSVAYIDVGHTLFVTAAVGACLNWLRSRAAHWLALAAIFAGFAAGTKYLGLFVLGLLGIIVLSRGVRERQLKPSLRFAAIAVAIAAPWYARSFYYTGNPFFPFLAGSFGHGFWSPEDASLALYDVRHYGAGRSLAAFASLPWQLAFHQDMFNAEAPGNPGFFLAMPALAAFIWKDARTRSLCAVTFAFLLFWFFGAQQMRFLLPVLPLISLSMAAALNSTLQSRVPMSRWATHPLGVSVIFALLISPGWLFASNVRAAGPVPTTHEQRDRYLAANLPLYPAYQLLNEQRGRNYTLYALDNTCLAYYADGTQIGDLVGPARWSRILSRLVDSRALYSELRSLGVDYLLLSQDPGRLHQDGFFHRHFKLVWARPPAMMFEIVTPRE